MRQFNRSLIATLILGAVASATPLVASDDWELLGSRRVSRAAERDAIEVTPREGRFNAIRIEVDGGAVQMYDVRVVFANGADFSPNTRLEFPDGASSRVLDLPGEARTIRRIVFRYKTSNPRGSLVRVYGRKADGGNEGPGNDPPPGPDGWDHIGAAEVDFRTDRDVISGRGEGAFRSIRLAVEGADIELTNVRVNFVDGESFSPDTRLVFEERSRSRVIDLPGSLRVIRNIEFHYRSLRRGSNEKAVVHVYGRK